MSYGTAGWVVGVGEGKGGGIRANSLRGGQDVREDLYKRGRALQTQKVREIPFNRFAKLGKLGRAAQMRKKLGRGRGRERRWLIASICFDLARSNGRVFWFLPPFLPSVTRRWN